MDASDPAKTGDLLVDHRSYRYLFYRLAGLSIFHAAPILGAIIAAVILQAPVPDYACLWGVVAVTVAGMAVGTPGMRISPSYRIYEKGFQPYLKPYRYSFWSFFIPFTHVKRLEVRERADLLGRTCLVASTKKGATYRTPMAHLDADEVLFLAELLREQNADAAIELGALSRGPAAGEGGKAKHGAKHRSGPAKT